jgi:hypothetical protein
MWCGGQGQREGWAREALAGWIESVDGPPLSKGLQESGDLQSSQVTMGVAGFLASKIDY